jgi:hypothetical protein
MKVIVLGVRKGERGVGRQGESAISRTCFVT